MKLFLEKDLGWNCIEARMSGHSISYLMERNGIWIQLERKSDGSFELSNKYENRIIPNRETLAVALGKRDATELDQQRILSQVLDKIISRSRTATEAEVQDMMQSFASGRRKPW